VARYGFLITGLPDAPSSGSGMRSTTAVTYEWDVETTTRWLSMLAPVARPLFAWNHDRVMRASGERLAKLIGGAPVRMS
jgi:hypothetical protein